MQTLESVLRLAKVLFVILPYDSGFPPTVKIFHLLQFIVKFIMFICINTMKLMLSLLVSF